MQQELVIGTRGSPLALAQAHMVRDALLAAHPALSPDRVRLQVFTTRGDRILDRPLAEIGGKGLFTEELEAAMLDGAIDCAVHSTKDMPTALPERLTLAIFLEREDPRDALLGAGLRAIADLPKHAVVGTSSLRRQAQLLHLRPDLSIIPFRGNVGTRLKKLEQGVAAATLLAAAGINRLGLDGLPMTLLDVREMLPAPAQGAVTVECRRDDQRLLALLAPLDHRETRQAISAERAFLAGLEGNCRTPIAALATLDGDQVRMTGRLLSPDGAALHEVAGAGSAGDCIRLGAMLADEIRGKAGPDFLRMIG